MITTTSHLSADRTGRPRRAVDVTRVLPRGVQAVLVLVLCVGVVVPVSYVLFCSLNSDLGVAEGDFFPDHFTWANYVKIWNTVPLANGLMNSLIVAGCTAVAARVVASATAYVLVRFAFAGRVAFLRGLLALHAVPGNLILLPLFVVFETAGSYLGIEVIGTRWGLFIAYLTFALPFSTWVMVTYLRGLPVEIEHAARLDGASNLTVLRVIVLPLSWPGLVVCAVFAFLSAWNDVLFASVITSQQNDTQTVSIVLGVFGAGQATGDLPLYGQMMAASLISAAPVVVLYLIFQRYLASGLALGGVQ